MPSSRVEAWAKVNLTLHVTGKRPDGYHLLDSLVVFAGIGDIVSVRPAPTLTLTTDGPTAPLLQGLDGNIVLKAAQALATRANVATGAALALSKHLPVAAGIGGGSADAAATLMALLRLWNVDLPPGALHDLALSLGADVPVCLRRRPTRMSGIGDILADVPALPPAWLVLINPGIGLSTPAVFRARTGDFSAAAPLDHPPRDAQALALWLGLGRNDLEDAAISLVPAISDCLDALRHSPDCLLARMSGSGATCFGLFATQAQAQAAARAITQAQPKWWCHAAAMLSAS